MIRFDNILFKAHIAGLAAKNVRRGRVNSIIGLDPAGPLFSVRDPTGRLDRTDANYVEVMHTNGPLLLVAGAGIGAPIGDADFWPNGGSSQPGCLTNTCSHGRAVDFYGRKVYFLIFKVRWNLFNKIVLFESIQDNSFYAHQCPDRDDISSRRCTITPGAWMGGDSFNFHKSISGSFYLETNRNYPRAQGPRRPT